MSFLLPSVCLALFVPVLVFSNRIALFLPSVFPVITKVVFAGIFPAGVLLRTFLFSRTGEKISRALCKCPVFEKAGLSPDLSLAVIAGQTCGFPMGALLISNSLAAPESKEKALALSSLPSLAFFMSVSEKGAFYWVVSVLTLWIYALVRPAKKEEVPSRAFPLSSFSKSLSESVAGAVQVSGAIIFFSSLIALLPDALPQVLKECICALLEIGTAAAVCKTPVVLAFALSFSGLSAMAQVYYLSGGVGLKEYLLSRLSLFPVIYFVSVFEEISLFTALFLFFVLLFLTNLKKPLKRLRLRQKRKSRTLY